MFCRQGFPFILKTSHLLIIDCSDNEKRIKVRTREWKKPPYARQTALTSIRLQADISFNHSNKAEYKQIVAFLAGGIFQRKENSLKIPGKRWGLTMASQDVNRLVFNSVMTNRHGVAYGNGSYLFSVGFSWQLQTMNGIVGCWQKNELKSIIWLITFRPSNVGSKMEF